MRPTFINVNNATLKFLLLSGRKKCGRTVDVAITEEDRGAKEAALPHNLQHSQLPAKCGDGNRCGIGGHCNTIITSHVGLYKLNFEIINCL